MATKPQESFLSRTWDYITETQLWRSIFRHGMPSTNRNRVLVVMTNVFLHLHPVKIRKSGIRLKFTWCMGGLTFFLFLVETFTGLLLMFYYRPTVAFAYMDIIDLAEQVPLGIEHGPGHAAPRPRGAGRPAPGPGERAHGPRGVRRALCPPGWTFRRGSRAAALLRPALRGHPAGGGDPHGRA